ncbi:hypothetical protein SAMN05428981_107136 [Bacillus sp. OV194]|nr:hypothetical protein SAMN05428981_107136 [Bacillus sp. OV194]
MNEEQDGLHLRVQAEQGGHCNKIMRRQQQYWPETETRIPFTNFQKLMTQEELASAVGTVLGKEVSVQQVDDTAYADIMMLVDIQKGIRDGELEVESNDFEKLLGRPLTPINEALS